MNINLSISTAMLLLSAAAMLVTLITIVMAGRAYFTKQSVNNLTDKYKDKKWASPLTARNKYPDVDVFQLRGLFLRLGIIASLSIVVLAFNWTSYDKKLNVPESWLRLESEDIEIETPRSEQEPPPPPPPPPPPVIQEVAADLLVDAKDVDFVDQSVDARTEIMEVPVVMERKEEKKVVMAPPPPPPPPAEEEIFKVVEEMPRFPGCENLPTIAEKKACADRKLMEFIYANIEYPNIARENNIEGTVVIRFVIDKDGKVKDAEIVREIGGGCGEAALKVVKKMNDLPERWSPGKQRGRPVSVYFTLPVKFMLKVDP